MVKRFISVSITLCVLFAGLAACDRKDGEKFDKTVKVDQPNSFARYINKIAALPSGDYTIVAATSSAGASGDFTLTVSYDDGSVETFSGSWTSSGGQDPASSANPSFPITVQTAGGIDIKLESSVDTYLYLVSANGLVFAENDNISGSNSNSQITLDSSRIDSEEFGAAYYATIDPLNEKDTLEKWKLANGYYEAYAAGRVVEPRFRDTKDLGYGRGMRMWTKPDGSLYFFVENFQVRTIPGLEYTSNNLDALLLDDRKHHFGTNAIEFSTYPYGAGEPSDMGSTHKFAKFFTFDASQTDTSLTQDHENETRLNRVNLDSRGAKAMPGACVYCHGGTLRPLRADGSYRDNTLDGSSGNGYDGDVNAKLQLLEVPSFEFWEQDTGPLAKYTRANQEPDIKQVNQAIYCSYPNLPDPSVCSQFCEDPSDTANCGGPGVDIASIFNTTTGAGEWSGAFAREMAEGWYSVDRTSGTLFDRDTFNDNYVPDAWQPDTTDGNPPAGSDKLFLDVVQPICFVCHSRRGTTLGSNLAAAGSKDIDFSSYSKFISHADQIKKYVYDYGVMPLSLRGYNAFWGSDAPLTLASHINGKLAPDNQVATNSAGFIDEPGAPIVDAGPDIETTSPARTFGSNSRFVDSYSWSIVSTPVGGESASLTDADKPRALLTAAVDGDYVLRLVAGHGDNSAQDTVTIKINSVPAVVPKVLNFVDDIKPIFNETAEIALGGDGKKCNECHSNAGGAIIGVPMWWTDTQPGTGSTLYQEALTRVDFNDPENSLILTKPTGHHHYGGLRNNGFDVDNPSNRYNYDTMLNWILEGARYDSSTMREP